MVGRRQPRGLPTSHKRPDTAAGDDVVGERGGLEQRTIDVRGHDFDFSSGWQTAGCSVSSDRLVAIRLQRELPQQPTVAEVAVLKLGSGEVRSHLSYADLPAAIDPVLSHDGRYLAENDPQGAWAAIRDLRTGQVIGHVAGRVVAFSGDDQLVLTSASQPADPHAAIVDWRWGRTIWAARGGATALAERPSGRELIVRLAAPASVERTILVRSDGRALDLDSDRSSVSEN